MEKAWKNLELIEEWKDHVKAETYHDLCRTQEIYNMMTVARCMITAASYRKESRFGQCHYRLDFPETDDDNWLGQVAIHRTGEGKIASEFVPLKYE